MFFRAQRRLLYVEVEYEKALTVLRLEDVEYGEELPVVGHEGLPDVLARLDQQLQGLQSPAHDAGVPGVQRSCR